LESVFDFSAIIGLCFVLPHLTEQQVRDELHCFEAIWSELFPAEQARLVQLLVERLDISEIGVDITLRLDGLTTLLQDLRTTASPQEAAA
jgi:site-specific DNA recombinase